MYPYDDDYQIIILPYSGLTNVLGALYCEIESLNIFFKSVQISVALEYQYLWFSEWLLIDAMNVLRWGFYLSGVEV